MFEVHSLLLLFDVPLLLLPFEIWNFDLLVLFLEFFDIFIEIEFEGSRIFPQLVIFAIGLLDGPCEFLVVLDNDLAFLDEVVPFELDLINQFFHLGDLFVVEAEFDFILFVGGLGVHLELGYFADLLF